MFDNFFEQYNWSCSFSLFSVNTVTAKTQFGYLSVVGEYDIEVAAFCRSVVHFTTYDKK